MDTLQRAAPNRTWTTMIHVQCDYLRLKSSPGTLTMVRLASDETVFTMLDQAFAQLVDTTIRSHFVAAKRIARLHVMIIIVGTSFCQDHISYSVLCRR